MRTTVFKHRVSSCPGCQQTLNATGDPKGRGAPRPRDVSVCAGCGTILQFDSKLRLTAMTPLQLEQLPPRSAAELQEMKDLWRERRAATPKVLS